MTQTASHASQPSQKPGAPKQPPQMQRQFVSFAFYKLDPTFRRLNDNDKKAARDEFAALFANRTPDLICLTYSTLGMRGDVDFLLWRISLSPDDFQNQSAAINKTTRYRRP